MATALQFLAKPTARFVCIVAGKSEAMRTVVTDKLVAMLSNPSVERYSAASTPIKRLMQILAEPCLFGQEIVIYENVDNRHDMRPLMRYVENPVRRRLLIITATEIRNAEAQRWIPSDNRILYIDCAHLAGEQLVRLAQAYGVPNSEWLVDRCQGDLAAILQTIDLLHCFEAPWTPELVESVLPPQARQSSYFDRYAILAPTEQSLLRQLKLRFQQLAALSEMKAERASAVELANRIDTEPFIVAKLIGMARATTPELWLARSKEVVLAEKYNRAGMPGVREYLEARLA